MAGSLTNTMENSLLLYLFNNVAIANIGSAAGLQPSASAGSFWVGLFTVTPSDSAAGTECTYVNYARQEMVRSGADITVSGNNASNAKLLTFPTSGGTTNQVVAFGIFTASTGGSLIWWGSISDPVGGLAVTTGVTPIFGIGDIDINLD